MTRTRSLRRGFFKGISLLVLGCITLSLSEPPAEAQLWYRRGGRGYYGRAFVGRPGFFGYNRGIRGFMGPMYGPMIYSSGYYGYGPPIVPYGGIGPGGYVSYGPVYPPIF